jgi:hypothetical protein
MTPSIAIFYHCLLVMGDPPVVLPQAGCIVSDQITQMILSGLWDAASEIHVGVNGGEESVPIVQHIIPQKAKITYHGLQSRSENLTIVMLHEWSRTHPDWNVLYLHAKGASHPIDSGYARNVALPWRRGMMHDLVTNWRQCVADLDAGYDIACSHWMWKNAPENNTIPAGNFLWVTSNFSASLPSLYERDWGRRGLIASLEARYEAEAFWGFGPRPNVKQYRPNGGGGVP